jgi:hypothetical protein
MPKTRTSALMALGPGRACKLWARAFAGLARPGLRAQGLDCGLSPQNPGPRGLGLLVYVVKAWARPDPRCHSTAALKVHICV